jgi:hypothetical protein
MSRRMSDDKAESVARPFSACVGRAPLPCPDSAQSSEGAWPESSPPLCPDSAESSEQNRALGTRRTRSARISPKAARFGAHRILIPPSRGGGPTSPSHGVPADLSGNAERSAHTSHGPHDLPTLAFKPGRRLRPSANAFRIGSCQRRAPSESLRCAPVVLHDLGGNPPMFRA